jgi:Fe2+ transport system protein FeoA
VIVRLTSTSPGRLVKLASLGVMPGVRITLLQRQPAVVVRIAETSVALDGEVAEEILVDPAVDESGA